VVNVVMLAGLAGTDDHIAPARADRERPRPAKERARAVACSVECSPRRERPAEQRDVRLALVVGYAKYAAPPVRGPDAVRDTEPVERDDIVALMGENARRGGSDRATADDDDTHRSEIGRPVA